jgi:uncharacterized membrane protein YphA (DoxX/SURF4 family)
MRKNFLKLIRTDAPAAVVLVRLAVGWIFLSEGIQKFLNMLLGHGFWGFAEPASDKIGFWAMAHESRTDVAMLLCALFMLSLGAGAVSLDAKLSQGRPGLDRQTADRQRKQKHHVESEE